MSLSTLISSSSSEFSICSPHNNNQYRDDIVISYNIEIDNKINSSLEFLDLFLLPLLLGDWGYKTISRNNYKSIAGAETTYCAIDLCIHRLVIIISTH
jgi:hypothetical protein